MLTASLSAAQETGRITVIVGASSPVTEIARTDVVRIFLGQATSWRDGTRIWPVDQSMISGARKEFSRMVLKQSTLAVDNYWRKQIFAGRVTPPRVMDTDAAVVQFVLATPGAVGYVSQDYLLPPGVRALTLME